MSRNAQLIDDLRYFSEHAFYEDCRLMSFENLRVLAASLIGAGL